MLEYNTYPIVLDPAFVDRYCEWDTDNRGENEDGIGKCEDNSITREHGSESKRQCISVYFEGGNESLNSEEEEGHPKEREEALARVVSIMGHLHTRLTPTLNSFDPEDSLVMSK